MVRHFHVQNEDDGGPTFAIEFKTRNNDQLTRDAVLEMVNDVVRALIPTARVHLDNPHKTIIIHVLRTTVFLAIVEDFGAKKRYSLHQKTEQD